LLLERMKVGYLLDTLLILPVEREDHYPLAILLESMIRSQRVLNVWWNTYFFV
jgi:hypothetical protein